MKTLAYSIALLAFLCVPIAVAASGAISPSGLRLTVELQDGSRIVGANGDETFQFRSDVLGEMKLSLEKIRSIECAPKTNLVKLTTSNGDTLSAQWLTQEIRVETTFGPVKLPQGLLRNVRVSALRRLEISPGLVALWSAEGNADDGVGTHDGAIRGNLTFAEGKMGQAFHFDGRSSVVEVPDASSLRLTNELTVEFWAKRQDYGSDYIVNKGGDWTENVLNYGVAIATPAFGNRFCFLFAGGTRSSTAITDYNWHHFAVTARHGDADPKFYLDGVQQPVVSREGRNTINLYNSTQALRIGAQLASAAQYYSHAIVDELAIYNRVLSTAEIESDYGEGANEADKAKSATSR